jgi:hypothetical protein
MNKILFFIFVCLIVSCRDIKNSYFNIINKSDSSIYYAFSYSYPDTSLTGIDFVPYSGGNQTHKIFAHDGKNEVRDVFNLEQTTLVFIFEAHSIETIPWDSIVKHYTVLKRYQLTINDMGKMNWIITYP